jgi:hypothetical protein
VEKAVDYKGDQVVRLMGARKIAYIVMRYRASLAMPLRRSIDSISQTAM